MTREERIEKAFVDLIHEKVPVITIPAKVTAVDADKGTCDVEFIDDDLAPHKSVHLYAGVNAEKGLLVLPKTGSNVYVSIVNNNPQWAFVSLFTEIEEIRLRGNDMGGLIKIEELIKRLNAIEKAFNKHLNKYNQHKHTGVTTGAGTSAVPVDLDTQHLTETERKLLENTKVNHG